MIDSENLVLNAELSLAAYADLANGTLDNDAQRLALRAAGFSTEQAINFSSKYTVVTQYDDISETGETSFSATIFKDTSGQLTLAIKGTLELTDVPGDIFPTDLNILNFGAGYDQIVAMYNWWLRISSPVGSTVPQYNYSVLLGSLQQLDSVGASGELYDSLLMDSDQKLDVTGHSLGAHLALAFNTLFPNEVNQVTGFNTPGFIDNRINQEFFLDLGGGVPTAENSPNVTNIFADEASVGESPFNAIAGLHFKHNPIGEVINISIENQWQSDEPDEADALNHSQQILTDSLTVFNLLTQLDPSLSTIDYKIMLNASVIGTSASYERIIDALEAITNINKELLLTGNNNRDDLYEAINNIHNEIFIDPTAPTLELKPKYQGVSISPLTITIDGETKSFTPNFIESQAQNSIAYRYALQELNFFVISGNDSIYDDHNTEKELDIYNPDTDEGGMTLQYIEDRAKFLSLKIELALTDKTAIEGRQAFDVYYDVTTDMEITDDDAGDNSRRLNPNYIFGKDGVDSLGGQDANDHLYGGGGNDLVTGGKGNDYIEGNLGADTLRGDKGRDILIGGEGQDTLIGGTIDLVTPKDDNTQDILLGGKGNDIYHVGLNDIIIDSDGQGTIMVNGEAIDISGITPIADGSTTFTNNSDTSPLRFKLDANGTLQVIGSYFEIRNFEDGDFGISLTADANLNIDNVIMGTEDADNLDPNGLTGNLDIQGLGGDDEIIGGLGNDIIQGNEGDDEIFGDEGDDILLGDEGSDRLHGELGNDVIDGGLGRDLLLGHEDKDVLSGGDDDDLLAGGEQDDFLEGETGSDILLGGSGIDALFGGEGSDVLIGDREGFFPDNNWSFTVTDSTPGELGGNTITFNGITLFDGANPDGDLLRGGAGDDYLFGEDGNDQLYGDEDNDDLIAGEGDDFLDGGSGNDFLAGENGNDVLIGGAGNDELQGGAGNDNLTDEEGDNRFFGNDGDDVITAGLGNDVIDGGTGADVINAGDGNNTILGGTGNDILIGGDGDDQIDGNADDDTIFAGDGIDTVNGGSGNDFIDGGAGADAQLAGLDGDDEIHAGDGDDTNVQGNDGNDILYGDAGNDVLFGQAGDDQLFGGDGDDQLIGDVGQDQLDGGAGDDVLFGQADNDVLNGGAGIDFLNAGEGDDTLSGGADNDTLIGENGNDILFGDDGDDFLQGDAGFDSLHGGNGADILLGGGGFDALSGGAGNDQLQGGDDGDFLNGDADDDTLFGDSGNDVLHGGSGNDVMFGDAGDDVFRFEIGDGVDRIIEQGDTLGDSILLGTGINPTGTFISRENNNLIITHDQNTTDRLIVQDWFLSANNKLDHIEFADGTSWNQATIEANVNLLPTANNDTVNVLEDTDNIILASTLTANDTDPDNDPLSVIAVSNAVNGVVSLNQDGNVVFTPDQDYVGTASFDYMMTDDRGGYDTATATVNIQNVNDEPVANPDFEEVDLLEQNDNAKVLTGGPSIPVLTILNSNLREHDSAGLDNGGFVSVYSTGNPVNGTADIFAKLFDTNGEIVGAQFLVNTFQGNRQQAPEVAALSNGNFIVMWITQATIMGDSFGIAGQLFTEEGNKIGSEFLVNTFTDGIERQIDITATANGGFFATWETTNFEQGNEITTAIVGQLFNENGIKIGNEFLVNTQTNGNQSGPVIADLGDVGYVITWQTNEHSGDNNFQGVIGQIFDNSGNKSGGEFIVNTINDGNQFSASISSFANSDFIITWTSADPLSGTNVFNIAAQRFDSSGNKIGNEFIVNDQPLIKNDFVFPNSEVLVLDNQQYVVTWYEETDTTYRIVGQLFNENNFKLGSEFIVSDTDEFSDLRHSISSFGDNGFLVSWERGTNDAEIHARYFTFEDVTAYSFDVLANDVDIDSNDNPSNFTLDSAFAEGNEGDVSIINNQIVFNPGDDFDFLNTGETTDTVIDYTMSDIGGLSSSSSVTLTVIGVNDAPVVSNPVIDQVTNEDAVFNFTLPTDSFTDPDNGDGIVSYTASLVNGIGLPTWLSFDSTTLTFVGTPANDNVGSIEIDVTASDNAGYSVTDIFSLTVNNTNDAPILENPIDDQIVNIGNNFKFNVPTDTFADIDLGDSLTFSATLADGSPLPSWLNLEAGLFNGTPNNADSGILSIIVSATDNSGSSISDTFILVVNNNPESQPDILNASLNTSLTIQDSELLNNDLDPDSDPLSITNVNNAINGSVVLDTKGDVIFTPDTGFTGTAQFEYTITDGKTGFASDIVTVNVFNPVIGDAGDNTLIGTNGDDLIDGGAGNDTLDAGAGNDVLIGGSGNDTLIGGSGDDTYQFSRGDGNDIIVEDDTTATGGDVIQFSSDVASSDVQIITDGKDLVLNIKDSSDSIILQDWISGSSGYPINVSFEFGDGTFISAADLDFRQKVKNDKGSATVRGSRFNDRLYGDSRDNPMTGKDGNDILDGGAGNDTMEGGAGNDTYEFTSGFGNDIIIENDATAGNIDTVTFGSGVTPIDLMFERLVDSLQISQIGTADTVLVQDWYLGSEYQTEIFRDSAGSTLMNTQVDQLIQAMAAFNAVTGLDWVTATQQQSDQVETILATAWQSA